jgi:hypothetical protein
MLSRHLLSVLGWLSLWAGAAGAAEPPAPPSPERYDVQIRYALGSYGSARVALYNEMRRDLKAAGFERDPDDPSFAESEAEDPEATHMRGTIPADGLERLLAERHIRAVLLTPHGAKLPGEKEPVRVDLRLVSGYAPSPQLLLSRQTQEVLESLGFRPAVGYDTQGGSRLLGSLPAGQVGKLLEDLRRLPAAEGLPAPFRTGSPLRAVFVRPDLPSPSVRPPAPEVPSGQEKLTPDLRAVLAGEGQGGKPTRLDVILAATPGPLDQAWGEPLRRAVPGLVIEGRMGRFVTVVAEPRQALALAALPEVDAVRLPRPAQSSQPFGGRGGPPDPVKASGLVHLHPMGHRGKGTRLAVIDSDFRGWQAAVQKKQLPAGTRLVDLTRERNPDFQPEPFPGDPGPRDGEQPGTGTRTALTALRAAPEADLTLIRVDRATPAMLLAAARAINGEPYRTPSLDQRIRELRADREALDQRRQALNEEQAGILEDYREDEESQRRLQEYRQRLARFNQDERAYEERRGRYFALLRDTQDLKGVRVVANNLVWGDGYPVNGSSTLSRYLDDGPFRALWFQAAGDTRGQAWSGLFRDADGNGVMEFAPPESRLPAGSWTRELNFLAWQSASGPVVMNLPAGAQLRLSLQWREVHEGLYLRVGEDPYRQPLARLRLVVLYQPDPTGARRPADDLEVVAESAGLPQRLEQTLHSAIYEQTVDLRVSRPGRYAVLIEGRPPEGIRPPGEATLPTMTEAGELRPRLFVQTLAGAGRAVFWDYPTQEGSLGMPADARRAVTVGAADGTGMSQPYSAGGPPQGMTLLRKPEVLAYDEGEGTAQAAGFAAGLAASSRGAGIPRSKWLQSLQVPPGGVLRVPPNWLRCRPQ